MGQYIRTMVYYIVNDIKKSLTDIYFFQSNVTQSFTQRLFVIKIRHTLTFLSNFRKYIFKKYIYTINHKRIALNYFFFSILEEISFMK